MKKSILKALGIGAVLLSAAIVSAPSPITHVTQEPVEARPTTPLTEFVQKVMTECGAKGSEIFNSILGDRIAGVAEAEQRFTKREHREAFALLICIESKFNPKAKSSAGAVGLTQVMPQYAQEFATACGLGKLAPADLEYPEINLRVGACQFGRLIELHEGSVALALASYNSGANSPSVKRLSALVPGNPETDSYLAKFSVIKDKVNKP